MVSQVEHYKDKLRRMYLAQKIIESAAYNIHRNLRYYNSRGIELNDEMIQIRSLMKEIGQRSEEHTSELQSQ